MALTDTDRADVRFFMGYSVAGDTAYFPYRELAYSNVSYMGITLDDPVNGGRLQHLSDVEIAWVSDALTDLRACRAEIRAARSNLDTDQAAVWKHNRTEIAERVAEFRRLRLELCGFLGFPPGNALTSGQHVVRC